MENWFSSFFAFFVSISGIQSNSGKLDSRGVLNMLDRSYLFIKAVPAYHCDGFICGDYGFDIPQQGIMVRLIIK